MEKLLPVLKEMAVKQKGSIVQSVTMLPPSGSKRKYFRIMTDTGSYLAVSNPNIKENDAFVEFARHFRSIGLNVPNILEYNRDAGLYLQTDFGDTTLLKYITENKDNEGIIPAIYREVLDNLMRFQVEGIKKLNTRVCYPRSVFDEQSITWDLHYFKYNFLNLAGIPYDEQELEQDFAGFATQLLQADNNYFMYRDFQSRNIMINNGKTAYIDFQGGRKGPLQYDVASLLFEAKTNLSPLFREEMLQYYLSRLQDIHGIDPREFLKDYYKFVLIRVLQALGAYGLRGLHENKTIFLQSIPGAINNIKWLATNEKLPYTLKEMCNVLYRVTESESLARIARQPETFTLTVNSFSYKNGIPFDSTLNGGGFVFDCRALPNPGRLDAYKPLSGLDKPVIDYLQSMDEVNSFLRNAQSLVSTSVKEYLSRGFKSLAVNFGCTGGQHRSVFCAEQLAFLFKNEHNVIVKVNHRELQKS
ncbi:MAG: phosphotransferase [Bacteroidales bacterium]